MNKPMTPNPTPNTPQPPPGFRIIPPEWLEKNPLPMDAVFLGAVSREWLRSSWRGSKIGKAGETYATAQPLDCFDPTPDFRALCAELAKYTDHMPECIANFNGNCGCECGFTDLITRANAALKETQ